MGQWTQARLLAFKKEWYGGRLDNEGPACYELGTGGPRGGNLSWHYVGHTSNEKARMSSYGRNGSHLAEIITYHLNRGWHLYYRAWAFDTKAEAEKMERSMLARHEYDWNDKLNRR